VKSYVWGGSKLLGISILLSLMATGAFALQVNETIDNYQISFDAIQDTNIVAKFWDIQGLGQGLFPELGEYEISKFDALMAGNVSDIDKRWAASVVFIFKNPINTSSQNTTEFLLKNSTNEYVRVFDRQVDGHNAVFLHLGKGPNDPLMTYEAMYWLDEVHGTATKGVVVLSQWPWNDGAENFMNTVHVEELMH